MKILVTCWTMAYLSGSPVYNYELAMELKRQGHDVSLMSDWINPMFSPDGAKLRESLVASGVHCLEWSDPYPEQDLFICSELHSEKLLKKQVNTPTLVIVHSEYDAETPLPDRPQIIKYVCIRQAILEHIVKEHAIPRDKCVVIYNGVDRGRFKPVKRTKRKFYKIVIPCTLDPLREAFLNKFIDEATEDRRVFIYGQDCGLKLHENKWAVISPPRFNIESEIADADEVAGILLGRVNLEAWSCGVNSSIYDPVTLEGRVYPPPIDFDENHNIRNVVRKMVGIVGNLDDVTVVIPHYSARPQLAKCLESIRTMKNVFVIKSGSFAHNVNLGVDLAQTEFVLITNDDTLLNTMLIRNMMAEMGEYDVVGATPDQGVKGFDINPDTKHLELNPKGHYPSGALIMIRKKVFELLGKFNEMYINGAEDIDLFLTAESKGYKVKRIDAVYHHDESQSVGRFDKCNENELIFNQKWRGICHIGVGP